MALALIVTGVIAQETGGMTSKKGEAILPEADDWALSLDAVPVMNYLGNMLNGNVNNSSPAFSYPNNALAITGKMFKDEKTAYRGMLRLGFGSTNMENYVDDNVNTTDPTAMVVDSWKWSYNNIVLGGGLEMRRGKTRLQGFYGGMLMFGISGSKSTYTYGNAFSNTNQNPTYTNNWTASPPTTGTGARTTENKAGGSMTIMLRGFAGAEYFIFPKMSVGAEFGWGLGMTSTGEGTVTTEAWDAVGLAAKKTTSKTGKSSRFGIDTDADGTQLVPSASLNLTLHF